MTLTATNPECPPTTQGEENQSPLNKKAIKLQSVINYITIYCHNISNGIRIKILVTSSGNIRNQLVYVANHNKTFERHVQVSRFIWETPNIFLCIPMH